jgi:hypothetical protein
MGVIPSAVGGMNLPAVLVVAANAAEHAEVEIVGGPNVGNWIGAGGGTLVLRAPPAGGHVLVTAYALPQQGTTPLELELHPIDSEHAAPIAPQATLRSEIVLHIERLGDRRFAGGGWAGLPGSKLRIEAFAVRPLERISVKEIEYRGLASGGGEMPWVTDGLLCGTRGQGLPLHGFAVRLAPHLREAFDVVYRGAFFVGGLTTRVRNGEVCVSPIRDDALEAVEIALLER